MASHKNDLIVFDEEYDRAARVIQQYCDALAEKMTDYIDSINTVLQYAIRDKAISQALRPYAEDVMKVRNHLTEISKQVGSSCKSFVTRIDEADKFLY